MKINLIKHNGRLVPHSEDDRKKVDSFSDGAIYVVDIKNMDIRTIKQNSSLHLWCNQIANLLNKNNLFMKGVFGNDISWSMDLVKSQIVKATMKQVFDINSTTKLKRKQIDELVDYVTIAFASKGIEIPEFPSIDLWSQDG